MAGEFGFMPGEVGGIPRGTRLPKSRLEEFLAQLAQSGPFRIPELARTGPVPRFEIPPEFQATPTSPASVGGSSVQRVTGPNLATEADLPQPTPEQRAQQLTQQLPTTAQGDQATAQQMRRAGPMSPITGLPSSAMPDFTGPLQPTRLENLEAGYNRDYVNPPRPSLKQSLLQSVAQVAPIAIGGLFGGEAGAAGAAQGVNELGQQQAALREAHRKELLGQIEAERGRQAKIAEIEAQTRNQANRPMVVGADQTLVSPTGQPLYTGGPKSAPAQTPRTVVTRAQSVRKSHDEKGSGKTRIPDHEFSGSWRSEDNGPYEYRRER